MIRSFEYQNSEGVFCAIETEQRPFSILTESDIDDVTLGPLRELPQVYRGFVLFGDVGEATGYCNEYKGCVNIPSAKATLRYYTMHGRWAQLVITHIGNIHPKFEHSVTT